MPLLVHGLIALIAAHRADWETAEDHLSGLPDRSGIRDDVASNAQYILLARALLAEPAGSYGEAVGILSMAIDPDVAQLMSNRSTLLPALARGAFELADEATLAAAVSTAQQETKRWQLP